MAKVIEAALTKALKRSDVPVSDAVAAAVAAKVAPEVASAAIGAEALWPQLLRYAGTAAGAFLVSRGMISAADWEVIIGSIIAIAPPLYRVVVTLLARRG